MSAATDLAAVGVLTAGLASGTAAAVVWSRRQDATATSLAALLLAVCLWNVAYAGELLSSTVSSRRLWGDLKYIGIGGLTPAWLSFALCYAGRAALVTRRLLLVLAIEPSAVLVLLAVPATHDLVRVLPKTAAANEPAQAGPLFWAHLVYSDVLLLAATGLLIGSLLRHARAYWLQAGALLAAALVPWAANLLFNLEVGPFRQVDLTPVAFAVSGLVLTWGLVDQRLLRLHPLARSVLVDRMTDGVVVLDAYGRVADLNPAARGVLGLTAGAVGREGGEVLPAELLAGRPGALGELALDDGRYEVTAVPLSDRRGPAGRLLVLRDVTERARLDARLRELLADAARVADQLAQSLRPSALPVAAGLRLAACFRPAGSGTEIGGDFYDVFPVEGQWAFVLGDVSGKGAKAAAVTANARYALRALVLDGAGPAQAVRRLNRLVGDRPDEESYLTVVHGRVRLLPDGVWVTLVLGGHPQPLVVRRDGAVEAVGVPGSAIGLLAEVEVVEVELRLAEGDCLVLYTDGVSEARRSGRMYGDVDLAEALRRSAGRPAREVADGLLGEVLALEGQRPSDDIAILVLEAHAAAARSAPPAPRAPTPRTSA